MQDLLQFKKTKKAKLATILKALLNRVPVVVTGLVPEEVTTLVGQISSLVPFRKELIFYHHFLDQVELDNLYAMEEMDGQSERVTFQALPDTIGKLDAISNFKGWVVGCARDEFEATKAWILEHHDPVVTVEIGEEARRLVTRVEGLNARALKKAKFEKSLLQKIDAESAFALIEGILNSKIKYGGEATDDLLDLLQEIAEMSEEVKLTERKLLEKELHAFHIIAFLTYTILSKISALQELGVKNLKINEKTLKKALLTTDAPVDRLHDFITAEWGQDFSSLTVTGWGSWLGDALEGATGRMRA